MKSKVLKCLYIAMAFVCLVLGVIGIILPLLPTTPFLMLASFLLAKGSERFHLWFISTKLYKKHLEEFVKTRAMTLKKKLSILLPVSTMLIATFILVNSKHARIAIPFVIIFKYYYFFFHIETIKVSNINNDKGALINGEYIAGRNR